MSTQTCRFASHDEPCGGYAGPCNGVDAFTLADLANASPIVAAGAVLHAQV